MKKTYEKPSMEIINVEPAEALLVASGEHTGGHGRDNACEHNGHQWFCD